MVSASIILASAISYFGPIKKKLYHTLAAFFFVQNASRYNCFLTQMLAVAPDLLFKTILFLFLLEFLAFLFPLAAI